MQKTGNYTFTLKADTGYETKQSGRISPDEYGAVIAVLAHHDILQLVIESISKKNNGSLVIPQTPEPAFWIDPGDIPFEREANVIYTTTSNFDGNTLPVYLEPPKTSTTAKDEIIAEQKLRIVAFTEALGCETSTEALVKLARIEEQLQTKSEDLTKAQDKIANLIDGLLSLSVATCTCCTKTPDIQYHDTTCIYRRVMSLLS